MGFKEIIQKLGEGQRHRKAIIKDMDEQLRFSNLVQDRQLSANERELNRFHKEDREEQIKSALEIARKKRDHDIKFNHNPIDVKNITNDSDFEILKQRNQFSGRSNMFENQHNIHNSNKMLLNNGNILKHQGGGFI